MKRELIAILLALSATLFTAACGGDPAAIADNDAPDGTADALLDDTDADPLAPVQALFDGAVIADDLMTVTVPADSPLYYETCTAIPYLRADGQTERMKNNPWECNVVTTSLCGYWLDDAYHNATGPGCDVIECVAAAGESFSAFIGNYESDGTKAIPEGSATYQCSDAPIAKAIPYTGKFTAELRFYRDADCQEPLFATASFDNQ
ncbi:MAG: hypothetical protein FJ100_20885 [Deltaproteobacteria bacterium]|nr:hypothetical protein [Deltaproteobacteria bacterium]